jgi:hypothetical protein
MLKSLLSLMFIGLIFNLSVANFAFAGVKPEKREQTAEKVKQGVAKIGTGQSARIQVKLYDGTKIKGYVKDAGADSFTIVNDKTGQETTVLYTDVKQIKGKSLSTGVKIAIGLGILAAVLGFLLFLENYD